MRLLRWRSRRPTAVHGSRALRWIALVLVLYVPACTPAAGPRAAAPAQLRVMTYNIRAGNDLERRSNLSRVAALIDSVHADFVLLQEVDRRTARSGVVDQPDTLARLTGMHVVFGSAMAFDGGEFGVAILSRWPVIRSRVIPLGIPRPAELETRAYEPRTLVHVVAAAPDGELHVLATHVDHQGDAVFRQLQLMQLLAYVADEVPRDAAVILGGDLNARPDAAEVRALGIAFDDSWARCGEGAGDTFRSDRPDRRIDYLLLANLRCTTARVLDVTLSDHRPLIIDVVRR